MDLKVHTWQICMHEYKYTSLPLQYPLKYIECAWFPPPHAIPSYSCIFRKYLYTCLYSFYLGLFGNISRNGTPALQVKYSYGGKVPASVCKCWQYSNINDHIYCCAVRAGVVSIFGNIVSM